MAAMAPNSAAQDAFLAFLDDRCGDLSFQALLLSAGTITTGVAATQIEGWRGITIGVVAGVLGLATIQRTARWASCYAESYNARRALATAPPAPNPPANPPMMAN